MTARNNEAQAFLPSSEDRLAAVIFVLLSIVAAIAFAAGSLMSQVLMVGVVATAIYWPHQRRRTQWLSGWLLIILGLAFWMASLALGRQLAYLGPLGMAAVLGGTRVARIFHKGLPPQEED